MSLDTRLRNAAGDLHRSVEHFVPGAAVAMARRSRRRRLAGAVALGFGALAILVGTALLVTANGRDPTVADRSSPPSTAVTVTTAPTTAAPATTVPPATVVEAVPTTVAETRPTPVPYPAADAEQDVASLYAAWNAGDVEGVLSLLRDGPNPGVAIAIEGAGAQVAVECDPGVSTPAGTVEIRCLQRIVADRFYTPAGVTWAASVVFEVDETGVSWSDGFPIWVSEPTGEARDYLLAFDRWLLERHRRGQEASGWIWVDPEGPLPNWGDGHPCCPYSTETPAAARRVFELVPEFLTEPDDPWPAEPGPISYQTSGTLTSGVRDGEVLFTVEHDVSRFSGMTLTRQPDGVLVTLGWQGAVWQVHEIVPGDEHSPGEYVQVEIHHLWPEGRTADVLWLTDYSGVTRSTLTGFTPDESDTFTLLDALSLEGRLDLFGMHYDCRTSDGDIAAVLVSFESDTPVTLLAWGIDVEAGAFVALDDLDGIDVRSDCGAPAPRGRSAGEGAP